MIELRPGTDADIEHVKRALFEAVSWNPEREVPSYEFVIAHPELARYHAGWGRNGDLAVIAERDGDVVGASLCRVFTAEGNGPVNAIDTALRAALNGAYPHLDRVHLTDFKVRILDGAGATGAVTRVSCRSPCDQTTAPLTGLPS